MVPAAYVLLLRAGESGTEVLLQLRSGTGFRDGYWAAAAAGHVERGEAATHAACREAAEELGVTVDEADLVPLITLHRTENTGDPVDERVDFFYTVPPLAGRADRAGARAGRRPAVVPAGRAAGPRRAARAPRPGQPARGIDSGDREPWLPRGPG